MTKPPAIVDPSTLLGSEKRITKRLRKYWDILREERQFPSESDINPSDIVDIWGNCFIVKADNNCKREDYKYKYIGENIIKAYGADLTGFDVGKMAAPEADHLAAEYEHVLAYKRPVVDEGEIHLNKDTLVKYRQILLPIGDDGVNITAILGGMSYKIEKSKKKSLLFWK